METNEILREQIFEIIKNQLRNNDLPAVIPINWIFQSNMSILLKYLLNNKCMMGENINESTANDRIWGN